MKKNKQNGQQLCQASSVLTDLRVLKIPAHAITGPLGSLVLFAVSTYRSVMRVTACALLVVTSRNPGHSRAQLEWKEGFYLWGSN